MMAAPMPQAEVLHLVGAQRSAVVQELVAVQQSLVQEPDLWSAQLRAVVVPQARV